MFFIPLTIGKCCYYTQFKTPLNPAVFLVDVIMMSDIAEQQDNYYDAIISFEDSNYDLRNKNARNLNQAFQDIDCSLPLKGRNSSDPTDPGGLGKKWYCSSTRNPDRVAEDCQIGFEVQVTFPNNKTGDFQKPFPKNVTIQGETCHQEEVACKYYMHPEILDTVFGDIHVAVLVVIILIIVALIALTAMWYFRWRKNGLPCFKKKQIQVNEDVDEAIQDFNVVNSKNSKKRDSQFYKSFGNKYRNTYLDSN